MDALLVYHGLEKKETFDEIASANGYSSIPSSDLETWVEDLDDPTAIFVQDSDNALGDAYDLLVDSGEEHTLYKVELGSDNSGTIYLCTGELDNRLVHEFSDEDGLAEGIEELLED